MKPTPPANAPAIHEETGGEGALYQLAKQWEADANQLDHPQYRAIGRAFAAELRAALASLQEPAREEK